MRTVPARLLPPLAGACALLAAGGLLSACDKTAGKPEDPNAAKVAEAAANPTFSVAATTAQPILALQVRLTADTATVQNARFLRAPLRNGDGQPDLLVVGMAGDRIVHRYPIPDPLNAQAEPQDKGLHGALRLPEATTWIYMPATRFDVIEISPGRDDPTLPRGGRIEVGPVLARLCPNQRAIEDCALAAVGRGAPGTPPVTTQPGTTQPGTTQPGIGGDGTTVQSPTLPLPPPKAGR